MKKRGFSITLIPALRRFLKDDRVEKPDSALAKAKKRFKNKGFNEATIAAAVKWGRKDKR